MIPLLHLKCMGLIEETRWISNNGGEARQKRGTDLSFFEPVKRYRIAGQYAKKLEGGGSPPLGSLF